MLHIENAIVMKDTITSKYGFLSLTAKEVAELDADNIAYYAGEFKEKSFKEKHGTSANNLVLHGDVEEMDSATAANYIDGTTVKESEIQPFRTSYKCFCGERHGLDYTQTILHGSALDSWRCLMTFTGLPKYGVVINLKAHEKTI